MPFVPGIIVELDGGDPETSAPLHQLDVTAGQRHAHLVQRIDDHLRLGAVARRLPVVAAVQAGAGIHRIVDTGVANVLPVTHAPRLDVDRLEDVLVQHLGQVDEGSRAPVELPEDGVLAGREQPLVIIDVDQHPLEDDVQVERLPPARAGSTRRPAPCAGSGQASSWCRGRRCRSTSRGSPPPTASPARCR